MRTRNSAARLATSCAAGLVVLSAQAQSVYRVPPAPLVDVVERYLANDVDLNLNGEGGALSPDGSKLLVRHAHKLVPLAERAQPKWRGNETISIQLRTHSAVFYSYGATRLTLVAVPRGKEIPVSLPEGARIRFERWSPDGRHLACVVYRGAPGELWVVDAASGAARALTGSVLNTVGTVPFEWLGNDQLVATLLPADLGAPPVPPALPTGPNVEEASGSSSAAAGFFSVRPAPAGEFERQRFTYYATSELGLVGLDGRITRFPVRGVNLRPDVSPDGRYILVRRSLPPQRMVDYYDTFPFRAELYDTRGKLLQLVAERSGVSGGGGMQLETVASGRRNIAWRPDTPASIIWLEALDEGDPGKPSDWRDELFQWNSPFDVPAVSLYRSDRRIQNVYWGNLHNALVLDSQSDPTQMRLWRFDPARPGSARELAYAYAGGPFGVHREPPRHLPRPLLEPSAQGDALASFAGEARKLYMIDYQRLQPLVYDLDTGRSRPLWLRPAAHEERFVEFLDERRRFALTLRSSRTEPPNYLVRDLRSGETHALTRFKHQPVLRPEEMTHRLVTAEREDGLPLQARLFLPAGWTADKGPLPALFWLYSYPYRTDAEYRGSLERQASSGYHSYGDPLGGYQCMVLLGYAVVIFNPPIVGSEASEPHDTYIPQLIAGAKAMVEELARQGVIDPKRVAAGGHSGGGFTTANLLAHTDVFRAGIVSNGIYNRTLAPFGVAAHDERTLWQARGSYVAISPLFYADGIKEPLLILRGQEEEHMSIHPAESPSLFAAVRNLGGTVRYVEMPYEGHIYSTREGVMHVLWEVSNWLDRYVGTASAN